MFHELIVKTAKPIRKETRDNRIDRLRAAIVEAAKQSPLINEEEMRWINFRPPPSLYLLPKILYGQPVKNKNTFRVYAFDEDGKEILHKLGKTLFKKGFLQVNPGSFEILDFRVRENIPYLPCKEGSTYRYYTVSPMILYDKTRDHREWLAITKKYKESDPAEYERQIKVSISNLIRSSIAYQMKQRAKMANTSFVKNIDIDIERFHIAFGKYHKDQKPTPFLYLEFASGWFLPKFIGHHTGKGFGEILIRRERGER